MLSLYFLQFLFTSNPLLTLGPGESGEFVLILPGFELRSRSCSVGLLPVLLSLYICLQLASDFIHDIVDHLFVAELPPLGLLHRPCLFPILCRFHAGYFVGDELVPVADLVQFLDGLLVSYDLIIQIAQLLRSLVASRLVGLDIVVNVVPGL